MARGRRVISAALVADIGGTNARFAGAAHEMKEALIVNPYDEDSVADALSRAILMPVGERRDRWRTMMKRLTQHDVHVWRTEYLEALERPVPAS